MSYYEMSNHIMSYVEMPNHIMSKYDMSNHIMSKYDMSNFRISTLRTVTSRNVQIKIIECLQHKIKNVEYIKYRNFLGGGIISYDNTTYRVTKCRITIYIVFRKNTNVKWYKATHIPSTKNVSLS